MDIKRISSSNRIIIFLFAALGMSFFSSLSVQAQSSDDVLRYSLEYPSYDAVSMVLPGVADHTGFGSYQDNPAAMALAEKGYLSFDLSTRYVDETGSYLGNTTNFSDSQTGVGNLGFVYKFPTTRGSLVVGGGYSQSSNFNRALSVSAQNNESTLTDFYNSSFVHDDLYNAAYKAFALYEGGDYTTSVFRANGYRGIHQHMELVEKGHLGEYSAFIASEVMKDLFFGATIGFTGGKYTYERDFLESDRDNEYNNRANNTDIDDILSLDTIDATIEGFNAQVGLIYQMSDQLSLGAGYEFPSRLRVEEEFNTVISTTFDNGDVEEFDAPGTFTYEVVRPQRLKGGLTYRHPAGFTLSAAAEGVFYTDAEYDVEGVTDAEIDINNNIRSNFSNVVNFRGGLEYQMSDQVTPRIGYAYFASPTENFDRSRQMISGGFSARFNRSMSFNLGIQYSFWEDENLLYDYEDPGTGDIFGEWAGEDVSRLHVMAGFQVAL
ncbi:Outer membrane protein transport protein (OMPP1/FadL/TodX) [Fodinibius roseus]|uniref:Outer membrane protein transport protein (OMPP1/FadL/TodX) n=1 Tax=Fodinibius roseus TaxID=1194090 RepID=A0A1M5BFM3_9BACT|nr:outer membrane protein transport protein [Fodinibius roseus]SHF41127.1 Outer membrane protein transport protein (OMPP1/FadL/TodX) [Fodinibius roseus]